MTKHINIKISGKVQGVGFRFCTYEKFVDLGLIGKVENMPDGSVSVETEGEDEKLDRLIQWCKIGPSGAQVENVEVAQMPGPFIPLKNG
jgi:acylphosphatase